MRNSSSLTIEVERAILNRVNPVFILNFRCISRCTSTLDIPVYLESLRAQRSRHATKEIAGFCF